MLNTAIWLVSTPFYTHFQDNQKGKLNNFSCFCRNYYEENDGGEQKETGTKLKEKEVGNEIDEISDRFQRTKRETSKRGKRG